MKYREIYNYYRIAIYILFIYSGLIKWIPINFPIDFTMFFGALSLFPFLSCLSKSKNAKLDSSLNKISFLFYGLMFLFLFSNIYTISTVYAQSKSLTILMNIYAFIYPLIVMEKSDYKILKEVILFLTFITLILLAIIYINDIAIIFYISEESQFELLGYNIPTYLSIGAFISVSVLFLLGDTGPFAIFFKVAVLFFLILLAGRGPLLILLVCVFGYYLISRSAKIFIPKNMLLFLVLIIGAINFFDFSQIDFSRFDIFNNYDNDLSSQARFNFFEIAKESFYNNPFFGKGIGSSGLILINDDILIYPHNLFLEALIEVGFIGGILYLLLYIILFLKVKRIRNDNVLVVLFLIVFYHFGQDLKSNSFDSWRVSVCWLSIFITMYRFHTNELKETKKISNENIFPIINDPKF